MEYKRIILAIVLSFMVFLVWDLFFPKPPVKAPVETTEPPTEAPAQTEKTIPYKPTPSADKEKGPTLTDEGTMAAVSSGRTITVKTPLYIAQISERGAAFSSFVLTGFRETVHADAPLKEMISPKVKFGTGVLSFKEKSVLISEDTLFRAETESDSFEVKDQTLKIPFTWRSDKGIVIEKILSFSPNTYLVNCTVLVKNGAEYPIKDRPVVSLRDHLTGEGSVYGFEGPSALIDNDVKTIKIKDIDKDVTFQGTIGWTANQGRYFMSAVIPNPVGEASMRLDYGDDKVVGNHYAGTEFVVNPGTQKQIDLQFFFGPKSLRVLNTYDNDLAAAINFGMFDILAKPCLWLMNFIYDHLIPNYGVAIIILTLITKVLLWPLGTKSYKSMNDMKKLQPLVQQIREKHKNDKKKMNEETMALYRTYKINPLGGCLPMLVQIPVFFALYRMLYEAIELRHAPFLLWINDLSAPDRLFNFDFSIPFMQPPYGIPVLTVIMGASMLLQQKMSPPMGDPTQRKMMMIMPIVFTVIFINFSSGLVLYWLVNNVVSIGQQYYITKKHS